MGVAAQHQHLVGMGSRPARIASVVVESGVAALFDANRYDLCEEVGGAGWNDGGSGANGSPISWRERG